MIVCNDQVGRWRLSQRAFQLRDFTHASLRAFPVGIPTLLILFLAEMCSASDKQLVSDCRDDKGLLSRRYVTLRGRGTGAQANYELTRGTRRGRFAHYYERC